MAQDKTVEDLNAESVDTDDLKGDYPGQVRAISGGSVVASIDPTTTTTPIQDAIDAINAATGSGEIVTPDVTEETGNVTGMGGITIRGTNHRESTITFSDLSTPGFLIQGNSDGWAFSLENIELSGSDKDNRTAGTSAIHFTGNVPRFNMQDVRFIDWNGEVIHFDTGHPFSSEWQSVRFQSGGYYGTALRVDSGGPVLNISNLYTGSADVTDDIKVTAGSPNIRITGWNIGGSTGRAYASITGSGNASLWLDTLNYESGQSPTAVIYTKSTPMEVIGNVVVRDGTPDYVVELGNNNANKLVYNLLGGATNKINVSGDPFSSAQPSFWFGPSGKVDVTHGGSLEGEVRCLGSAGTGVA